MALDVQEAVEFCAGIEPLGCGGIPYCTIAELDGKDGFLRWRAYFGHLAADDVSGGVGTEDFIANLDLLNRLAALRRGYERAGGEAAEVPKYTHQFFKETWRFAVYSLYDLLFWGGMFRRGQGFINFAGDTDNLQRRDTADHAVEFTVVERGRAGCHEFTSEALENEIGVFLHEQIEIFIGVAIGNRESGLIGERAVGGENLFLDFAVLDGGIDDQDERNVFGHVFVIELLKIRHAPGWDDGMDGTEGSLAIGADSLAEELGLCVESLE